MNINLNLNLEYGSFAIKIESRDIVNHMIRNVILIANCPYGSNIYSYSLFIVIL